MRRTRMATVIAIASVWIVVSCADKVAAPQEEVLVPFAISAEQRAELAAALRFATREESMSSLSHRDAAAQITAAFKDLSDRIARNDRLGTQRAIEAARSSLGRYHERAGGDPLAALELETMSLTLEHVALLAGDAPAALLYGSEEPTESK